ncbi:MAG: secondary thiamine-phosphate synthase enzyme YjbQ [Anaerolineae bacterium]|jgi:secondary thiamine-phosphate synthase enzyme|nr:secondary thiamine-phosphate synthase enzyme YjbQ [Anaerolineae bacterium]MDH7472672.1 secondary thiamine-phosphate synthase enzyme YjbQ [Anaerolineae bacterium]
MIRLQVRTSSHAELVDITAEVQRVVRESGVQQGICHVFAPHTTAGLTLNENCDPSVAEDILMVLDKLVPWRGGYRHTEGNAAAHVKASLMGNSITMFVQNGTLALGTWQGLFLAEFDGPRQRQVWVKVVSC